MSRMWKHFFGWLLDDVCWVVIYPSSPRHQKAKTIRLSWTIARCYAKIFNGKVVHMDDAEGELKNAT
jgi:hypothetical protein